MSKRKQNPLSSPVNIAAPATAALPDDTQIPLKVETVRWLLSIGGALLVYLLIGFIVTKIYHPDTDALLAQAKGLFVEGGGVRPEPVESLLFRLGIIVILPSLFGFYRLFTHSAAPAKLSTRPAYLLLSVLIVAAVAALIFFDFAAPNPFGPDGGDRPQNARDLNAFTNFDFYFQGIFTGSYLPVYCCLVVPLLACLFFLGFKKYKWDEGKTGNIAITVAAYALVAWVVIAIILMNVYEFPYSNENKFDFNAVYYSMTQVYAGVPLLVNRFVNTYGLYPHFLNPIFQVTGLSVFTFSLCMSLLLGLCFVLNIYCLRQFISNKVILFLGITTVIFFPYLDFKLTTIFDSVFSLFPIRYIIPSLLLLLATAYFRRPRMLRYWAITATMALFILWNPEIGLVGYLSWLAVNTYSGFYDASGKVAVKSIVGHIIAAAGVAALVFYLYKILIFLFYGSWPDLSLLFDPILFFGKFGMGNLPMALVHPWNISVLIIVVGFTYSFVRLYKKDVTVKSSFVFLLSTVALGYFVYFQGRSQNSNFALSSSFSLMLLAILADELWSVTKRSNLLLLNAAFVLCLLLMSFSFVEIIWNTDKMVALIYQEDDKDKQYEEQKRLTQNRDFIMKKSKPGEKIFVFQPKKRQALYFGAGKRISAFNPGFIDMFLQADLDRLEHTLRDSSFNLFIEPAPGIYSFLSRPLAAFASNYEFSSYNEMMGLFTRRKTQVPATTFFVNNEGMVIHRKYTDDTAGKALRVNDAQGIAPIDLAPRFSVSLLFNSTFQVFENAALVGNVADTNGFVIGNMLSTSKYFFGFNKTGFAVPMPFHEWSYCVMNVFPDHFDVYRNGSLMFTRVLAHPMGRSTNKLFIGNMSGMHYYIGAIAEVAIANRVVDTAEMQHNWREMSHALAK